MKKIIVSCLAVVALGFMSGCGTDKPTHTTTTTQESTTVRSPVTTTTTDTQTK